MVNKKAVAHLLKREIGSRRRTTAKSARKKGPFSRLDAERELEGARSPEDALDTFFAFGSQFFEYSALFVVHGDLVEGRDAWGPGADHLRVLGLGVPLRLVLVAADGAFVLTSVETLLESPTTTRSGVSPASSLPKARNWPPVEVVL